MMKDMRMIGMTMYPDGTHKVKVKAHRATLDDGSPSECWVVPLTALYTAWGRLLDKYTNIIIPIKLHLEDLGDSYYAPGYTLEGLVNTDGRYTHALFKEIQ